MTRDATEPATATEDAAVGHLTPSDPTNTSALMAGGYEGMTDGDIDLELAKRPEIALDKDASRTAKVQALAEYDAGREHLDTLADKSTANAPEGAQPTHVEGDTHKPEPKAEGEDKVDYTSENLDQLKDRLRGRSLTVSGNKDELVKRLKKADRDDAKEAKKAEKDAAKEAGGSVGDTTAVTTDSGYEPLPDSDDDDWGADYTVTGEGDLSYQEVAAKFGYANYRELAAVNGVRNQRYELEKGQEIRLPKQLTPNRPEPVKKLTKDEVAEL